MLAHTSISLMLAQATVERGLLDTIAAGLSDARDRLEFYVGEGNRDNQTLRGAENVSSVARILIE